MKKTRKSRKQIKESRRKSIILIVISLLVFGLALFFFTSRPDTVRAGNGILALPTAEYDFGKVSVDRGVVSQELPMVNVGEDELIITFLDSSCGCTTAQVINDGKAGPIFGMSSHGRSPTNWQTVIKPGKKASLKIYYDPKVHQQFRGPATRVITISTNSLTTRQKKVTIKVNQID